MPSSRKLEQLLLRVVRAIEAQTRAIDRLAASNEELVDELMAKDGEDLIEGPELDLAGRVLDS